MVDITQDHDHDNKLEDYFFELLVGKHATDREIQDLLRIIRESKLHKDYKLMLSRLLFGEENLYIQDWGTLQQSLMSIAQNEHMRDGNIHTHGVVLELLFRMIEFLFDISDDNMLAFIMSHDKENVEHQIISLMKRVLDYFEIGFKELLAETTALEESIQSTDGPAGEYTIIEKSLLKYPDEILRTQDDKINEIKNEIDTIGIRLQKKDEITL